MRARQGCVGISPVPGVKSTSSFRVVAAVRPSLCVPGVTAPSCAVAASSVGSTVREILNLDGPYGEAKKVHPHRSPAKLTPDVDVSVCPPQTGARCPGTGRGRVVVLEVRIGVATRAPGAGGGRLLQASKLAAPVQDEVALGETGRMTPHATASLGDSSS